MKIRFDPYVIPGLLTHTHSLFADSCLLTSHCGHEVKGKVEPVCVKIHLK